MGKATQDLRKEHDAILHVLKISDKMMSADSKEDTDKLHYYKELVYFLRIFADKCHHGKEENYLFVELVKKGVPNEDGLIGVMLQEHNQSREYIALMNEAIKLADLTKFNINAIKYRDLLRSHIDHEGNVLFAMADELLDDKKQDELFEKFQRHEESVVGHGVHEELHAMIHRWAEELGM